MELTLIVLNFKLILLFLHLKIFNNFININLTTL